MNKLDELINELCPNGVEFVELWSVTIWDKRFNSVDREKQTKIISYPYLLAAELFKLEQAGGNVFLLSTGEKTGWTTEALAADYLCDGEVVSIPWGKSRPIKEVLKYYKGKFVTADNRIATSNDTTKLLNKYLYYWMLNYGETLDRYYRGSGIKHPNMNDVLNMQIPLPILPVQEEIVRILDNFTELTAKLTAKLTVKLTAELTARKKQYEYYRNSLLTFGDEVEWKTLREVCTLSAGGDVPKDRFSKEKTDKYSIPIYSNSVENDGLYGYTDIPRITTSSITIAGRGAGVGNTTLRKQPYFPIIRLISAVPNEMIIADFLYYVIKITTFKVPTSGIPQLTVPMISKYKIPIPPLAEQERIVKILDRFDALCNDISSGLPAEIKARQQQYEYYRDKLLTFPKVKLEV